MPRRLDPLPAARRGDLEIHRRHQCRADALSNLASPGVVGGALIVVGEDYGEGASVIQERTHAYALKSTLLLLDPRPELANMVRSVDRPFVPEGEHTGDHGAAHPRLPRARPLRLDNLAPGSRRARSRSRRASTMRLAHPPVTFRHEAQARAAYSGGAGRIAQHGLNERFRRHRHADIGLVVRRPHNNASQRVAAARLADIFGRARSAAGAQRHPLVPGDHRLRGASARCCWCWKGAQYVEKDIAIRRCAGIDARIEVQVDLLPGAGEYTVEGSRVAVFCERWLPSSRPDAERARGWRATRSAATHREGARRLCRGAPPGFCIGCPERPVFAAKARAAGGRAGASRPTSAAMRSPPSNPSARATPSRLRHEPLAAAPACRR